MGSAVEFLKDTTSSYIRPDASKTLTENGFDAASSSTRSSDSFREPATDKFAAAAKPDSQKTYTESTGDFVKGKADAAASYIQPDSNKSFTQGLSDPVGPDTHPVRVGEGYTFAPHAGFSEDVFPIRERCLHGEGGQPRRRRDPRLQP